ncbi:MAG TPA: glycoside hydrolase family 38 C-terminal domain-containing protein [Armatimonadota bacterium]|nr:glycoside hydrolase family 38 C-terminal domain-containing protein [Armatimonadota bacterium]
MNKTTVHMVGNAHIDPAWLWRWQEGFSEVLASCRSALDRMNETPGFIFCRSSSITYKWIEQTDPEMFEEIRRRVAEGRWIIVNGWIEQPDCNIPSGESFVRQSLYGKRYFLDKFGVDVNIGYNVDSFGHSAGLPQILAKSGFKYYIFFRPGAREKTIPENIFWWEGPDGSRVLAVRPPRYYCTFVGEDDMDEHIEIARDWRPEGLTNAICFYGVGNHGGGPTKRNLEFIQRKNAESEKMDVIFSHPGMFLEAALSERTDFAVVRDDLQHHAVGCYTSYERVKLDNRRCELLLGTAEMFSALAQRKLGRAYPKADFAQAWENVLFNQFHDILAGTSIYEVCQEARDAHGWAAWTAAGHLNGALQTFALAADTSGMEGPIVVFNPLPWPVTRRVDYSSKKPCAADEQGKPVLMQVDELEYVRCNSEQLKFFVADLPPLGWRVFDVRTEEPGQPSDRPLEVGDNFLENEWWRIEFGPDGMITQVRDKKNDVDVLSGPITLKVYYDKSDTWGHYVERYDDEVGRFVGRAHIAESGPVRASIRTIGDFGSSSIRQDVTLYRDIDTLEIRTVVDWHEKERVLKLCVPVEVDNPSAEVGAAYAYIDKDTEGYENPFQRWIDVTGKKDNRTYGAAVLCEGKYGYDVTGSEIRMTLLRSPAYAMHHPMVTEPGKLFRWLDQGVHEINWRLVPHVGDWREAGIPREAEVFANPPITNFAHAHTGQLGRVGSLGELEPGNVILGAIKLAEDNDDLIVRLYESEGRKTTAKLQFGEQAIKTEIGPYELKTLRITPSGEVIETDLIERPTK